MSAGFSSIRSFTLISFSVKPAASGLNNRAILSRAASRLLYFPPLHKASMPLAQFDSGCQYAGGSLSTEGGNSSPAAAGQTASCRCRGMMSLQNPAPQHKGEEEERECKDRS